MGRISGELAASTTSTSTPPSSPTSTHPTTDHLSMCWCVGQCQITTSLTSGATLRVTLWCGVPPRTAVVACCHGWIVACLDAPIRSRIDVDTNSRFAAFPWVTCWIPSTASQSGNVHCQEQVCSTCVSFGFFIEWALAHCHCSSSTILRLSIIWSVCPSCFMGVGKWGNPNTLRIGPEKPRSTMTTIKMTRWKDRRSIYHTYRIVHGPVNRTTNATIPQ